MAANAIRLCYFTQESLYRCEEDSFTLRCRGEKSAALRQLEEELAGNL